MIVPLISILLPFAAIFMALIRPSIAPPALCGAAIITTVVSVWGLVTLPANTQLGFTLGGWELGLGIHWSYHLSSALLLVFSNSIVALVGVYQWHHDPGGSRHFWILSGLLQMALAALWLTQDLFNTYVLLELITLIAIGLMLLAGPSAYRAAWRYLIWSLGAALTFLLGVTLLYSQTGLLHQPMMALPSAPITALALVLCSASLMLKAALWPLHFWLPPAHAQATTAVSALLSAVVVKAPLIVLAQLWWSLAPLSFWTTAGQILTLLGSTGLLWGSIAAYRAHAIKRRIAHSTVAQLGFITLVLGLSLTQNNETLLWLAGGWLIAHGYAKGSLFLTAGTSLAEHRKATFALGLVWLIASLSLIGVPPSPGFLLKWELIQHSISPIFYPWVFVGVLLSGLMTASYLLPMVNNLVSVRRPQTLSQWLCFAPMAFLLLMLLWWLQVHPLELRLGVANSVAKTLLILSAIVVPLAAWAAARMPLRFWLFWWLSLSGFWLICLALDALTLIIGFALMSLSAWGLIGYKQDEQARFAAKRYLIWALVAEALIVGGMALRVQEASGVMNLSVWQQTPAEPLTATLLLLGFGIKAGLWPLHRWLPKAHPAAPAPASALLSGLMIKAGIYGLWLLLPSTHNNLTWLILSIGAISFVWGVGQGLRHAEPKVILAYSSISQIGLMILIIGLSADVDPAIVTIALSWAILHHGTAKSALFLGVGSCRKLGWQTQHWVLIIPMLALIGFPMTSGMFLKSALKTLAAESEWLSAMITLSAIGTLWLMAHLLRQCRTQYRASSKTQATALPFIILSLLSLIWPWIWLDTPISPHLIPNWQQIWPLILGVIFWLGFQKISV